MAKAAQRLFDDRAHLAPRDLLRQEALTKFAFSALDGTSPDALIEEATKLARAGLGADLSAVMRYDPSTDELMLQAGEGWAEGEVGEARIPAGLATEPGSVSLSGYAMIADGPVLVEDFCVEPRLGPCPILRRAGAVSAITTKIYDASGRYGLLGAYHTSARAYTDEEASWLQDVASVVTSALSRQGA